MLQKYMLIGSLVLIVLSMFLAGGSVRLIRGHGAEPPMLSESAMRSAGTELVQRRVRAVNLFRAARVIAVVAALTFAIAVVLSGSGRPWDDVVLLIATYAAGLYVVWHGSFQVLFGTTTS
jgi:hypothetical protein